MVEHFKDSASLNVPWDPKVENPPLPTGHAVLGASSATRWINCPGCIQLIATVPSHIRSRSSEAAAEGTAAHTLGEMCLDKGKPAEFFRGRWIKVEDWKDSFEVDSDMIDAVQLYLDFVADELDRLGKATELRVEASVKPFDHREDMWGTADAILIQPFGELVVVDYKHGKGVVVEPEFNDQMMFYGLGALRSIGPLAADVTKVTLVIVQPRAFHERGPIRKWETTPEQLLSFGDMLQEAADQTAVPGAKLTAGKHCKFCPAEGICPERRGKALAVLDVPMDIPANAKPKLPDPADPAQVGRALTLLPEVDGWIKAVQAIAFNMANAGEKIPGHKLVRKGANRRWRDSVAVENELLHIEDNILFKPREVRSPAQLEKIPEIGKDFVAKHAMKPQGGVTLAADSDPREEIKMTPLIDLLKESLK